MLCLRQFPGAEGGCVSRDCREAVLYGGQDGGRISYEWQNEKGLQGVGWIKQMG